MDFSAGEERRPEAPADGVAHAVADDRRRHSADTFSHQMFSAPVAATSPARDQQRIAGQEEADEQPGFGEDDRREHDVAAPPDQRVERDLARQDAVESPTASWSNSTQATLPPATAPPCAGAPAGAPALIRMP